MTIGSKKKAHKRPGQLQLDFERPIEQDRNFHKGGRSFYFFDFDDNVAFLATPIVIFHKESGREKLLGSKEYALHSKSIGSSGKYLDFCLDYNDDVGSFRYFRDEDQLDTTKKRQQFLVDVQHALERPDYVWKAPSWNFFYHATYNKRPLSIITARGHGISTIKQGIDLIVKDGHLPHRPNYLGVYPVSHPMFRKEHGQLVKYCVADLKRRAIRSSVEKAIEKYGYSPFHRFGMSDDDPKNIEMITQEMHHLKSEYPEMSFFVIDTSGKEAIKREVYLSSTKTVDLGHVGITGGQLSLF